MNLEELENLNFFAYYRVSTEIQSKDMQKKIVDDMVKDININVIDEFEDLSYTGALGWERPALTEMYSRIDEVNGIIVYDWDRISREEGFAVNLMYILREKNKIVVEANTRMILDFAEMSNRILTFVKSVTAEQERLKINQRQRDGIKTFKDKYGRWGRSKSYGKNEQGTKLDKKNFWYKYEIYRLANISKSSIARLLFITTATLYRRLKEDNKKYEEIELKRKERYKIN